jgi:hypothetical protein
MKKSSLMPILCFIISYQSICQVPDEATIKRYNDILLEQPGNAALKIVAVDGIYNAYAPGGVKAIVKAFESIWYYHTYGNFRKLGSQKPNFNNIFYEMLFSVDCQDEIFDKLIDVGVSKYGAVYSNDMRPFIDYYMLSTDLQKLDQLKITKKIIDKQSLNPYAAELLIIYLSKINVAPPGFLDQYRIFLGPNKCPTSSDGNFMVPTGPLPIHFVLVRIPYFNTKEGIDFCNSLNK